jgi:hypothetical protein
VGAASAAIPAERNFRHDRKHPIADESAPT